MVELSFGNQYRIMVEATSSEYFITVFCKWFYIFDIEHEV